MRGLSIVFDDIYKTNENRVNQCIVYVPHMCYVIISSSHIQNPIFLFCFLLPTATHHPYAKLRMLYIDTK